MIFTPISAISFSPIRLMYTMLDVRDVDVRNIEAACRMARARLLAFRSAVCL
jgi:hypothetical protein